MQIKVQTLKLYFVSIQVIQILYYSYEASTFIYKTMSQHSFAQNRPWT